MQDFEKHEEERSDFLQERFLHYIDACVVMQESIAEVSVTFKFFKCGVIAYPLYSLLYTVFTLAHNLGWVNPLGQPEKSMCVNTCCARTNRAVLASALLPCQLGSVQLCEQTTHYSL